MIIKPRVKDYLCLTAHPEGCKKNVADQIAYVKAQGEIPGEAKKVLVIGCSTGYGLASRIVTAFGWDNVLPANSGILLQKRKLQKRRREGRSL